MVCVTAASAMERAPRVRQEAENIRFRFHIPCIVCNYPLEPQRGVGTHRGRKWDCSLDRLTLSWGTSGILSRRQVCQDLLSAHSGTLRPGVRRVCLQGPGDWHAASSGGGAGSPSLQLPPVLALERACFSAPSWAAFSAGSA